MAEPPLLESHALQRRAELLSPVGCTEVPGGLLDTVYCYVGSRDYVLVGQRYDKVSLYHILGSLSGTEDRYANTLGMENVDIKP